MKKPRRTLEELVEQQNQKAAELSARILARDAKARAKLVDQLNQVQAKMGRAVHKIVNRFDAVTNAQRQAREYGVGFIRVEPDGSMSAIDPRSVILK